MGQIDYLTEIFDRKTIEDIVFEKIKNNEMFSFGILDIDNFKEINDTYGHQFGDVVIKKVAQSIVDSLKNRGIVGRLGGDEFAIIINGVDDFEIRQVCSGIRNQISFLFNSASFVLSASIGVNRFPLDSNSFDELFKKADKCLYIAKRKGKNRYIIYDEKKHGSNENIIYDPMLNEKDKFSDAIMLADLVHNLKPFENKNAIRPAINQILTYFALDRISVYYGENFDLLCSVGKLIDNDNAKYITDKEYLKNFNIRNVCLIENIPFLQKNSDNKELYEVFKLRDVKTVFQYLVVHNGKPLGAVSYEISRNSRVFSSSEITALTLTSILISDILIKDI